MSRGGDYDESFFAVTAIREGQTSVSEGDTAQTKFKNYARTVPITRGSTELWFALIVIGMAIPIAGKGSITALILAFVLLIGALPGVVLKLPMMRMLWLTATIWSGGQAISNYSHGQYYMTFLIYVGLTIAILASGLYWIHETVNLSPAAISVAVGLGWLFLKLATGVLDTINPWKYGLSIPVAIIIIGYAYHKKASQKTIAVLFVILAITSRIYDNRIQVALFALAAITVLFVTDDPERQRTRARKTIATLGAVVVLVYLGYPTAANEGVFGQRAMAQQQRDDNNDANFLLSIRKELPLTIYLAAQNPVFGIGSYSKITRQESSEAISFVEEFTGPIDPSERVYLTGGHDDRAGYKAHSAAVSAVLFAGFLAAPFWIWLIIQNTKGLLLIARGRAALPGLTFYMICVVIWDLLFSPMNSNTHLTIGFLLFLIAVSRQSERIANPYRSGYRSKPHKISNVSKYGSPRPT